MKILTHPDNVELLKPLLHPRDERGRFAVEPLYGIQFQTNKHLDREKWSGKYVLPSGKAVPPADVVVPEGRFFEWTEPDIWWLLKQGIIRKQMEPLFYMLDEKPLEQMMTASLPMVTKFDSF